MFLIQLYISVYVPKSSSFVMTGIFSVSREKIWEMYISPAPDLLRHVNILHPELIVDTHGQRM